MKGPSTNIAPLGRIPKAPNAMVPRPPGQVLPAKWVTRSSDPTDGCTFSAQKVRKLYPMLFGAWALGPANQRALSIGYVARFV